MHRWLAVSKPQCFSIPRCISWCIQSLTCDTPFLSLLWISMCVPSWIGCCTIGIWLIDGHSSTWLISCLQKNTYTQVNIKKLKPSANNWKNWNKYCTCFCLEILLFRPPLAAVGSEEFPLTSPLQLLLLWPILPVIPQFDWLCDVCGCVMSPTSGIYRVDLGFINNYKEPQLWLVLLRYSADVASAFPWVVIYGIRADPVISCGLRDTTPQSGP